MHIKSLHFFSEGKTLNIQQPGKCSKVSPMSLLLENEPGKGKKRLGWGGLAGGVGRGRKWLIFPSPFLLSVLRTCHLRIRKRKRKSHLFILREALKKKIRNHNVYLVTIFRSLTWFLLSCSVKLETPTSIILTWITGQ